MVSCWFCKGYWGSAMVLQGLYAGSVRIIEVLWWFCKGYSGSVMVLQGYWDSTLVPHRFCEGYCGSMMVLLVLQGLFRFWNSSVRVYHECSIRLPHWFHEGWGSAMVLWGCFTIVHEGSMVIIEVSHWLHEGYSMMVLHWLYWGSMLAHQGLLRFHNGSVIVMQGSLKFCRGSSATHTHYTHPPTHPKHLLTCTSIFYNLNSTKV